MLEPLWSTSLHLKWVASFVVVISFLVFLHPRRAIHGPEVNQRPIGQEEAELATDKELEGSLTLTSYQNQQGGLSPLSVSGKKTQSEPEAFSKLFFSLSLQKSHILYAEIIFWEHLVSFVQAGYLRELKAERELQRHEIMRSDRITLKPSRCIIWRKKKLNVEKWKKVKTPWDFCLSFEDDTCGPIVIIFPEPMLSTWISTCNLKWMKWKELAKKQIKG